MLRAVTKSIQLPAGRTGFDGDIAMLRSEFLRLSFVVVPLRYAVSGIQKLEQAVLERWY